MSKVDIQTEPLDASTSKGAEFINFINTLYTDLLNLAAANNEQIDAAETASDYAQEVYTALLAANGTVTSQAVAQALREQRQLQYGASGFVSFGGSPSESAAVGVVNEGIHTWNGGSNYFFLGHRDNVYDRTPVEPLLHAAGSIIKPVRNPSSNDINRIFLPPAPDGLDAIDPDDANAVDGRFPDIASAITSGGTSLSASVINRTDLVGIEVFHESISDKDIWCPNGMVQFDSSTIEILGTTINLVTLSSLGIDTGYGSMYEGDGGVEAYVAKWSTLTDAQKDLILAYEGDNIYNTPDGLVQVRARARSIAGKEGAWDSVNFNDSYSAISFDATANLYLRLQGKATDATAFTSTSTEFAYGSLNSGAGRSDVKGVASSHKDGYFSNAYNGECYFVPIALVSRRNQLAYHPVHNENGASRTVTSDGSGSSTWYNQNWISSLADCADGKGNAAFPWGSISSALSGHKADLYYDAIYADDIEDLRLDVSGNFDLQRFNDFGLKQSVNGNASERNTEYLPFTRVESEQAASASSTSGAIQIPLNAASNYNVGDLVTVLDASNTILIDRVTVTAKGTDGGGTVDYLNWDSSEGTYNRVSGETYTAVIESTSNIKSKYWTDIAGDPTDILATFPNGVHGTWLSEIPDSTSKSYKATRKALANLSHQETNDNGATWSGSLNGWDLVNSDNTQVAAIATGTIRLINYEYAPNFTEPVNRVYPHWFGNKGFAINFATAGYGVELVQSLINKISTGLSNPSIVEGFHIHGYKTSDANGFSNSSGYEPKHDTINLAGVDSPAVKVFPYVHLNDYGILELYLVYKELVHNGTSFGDDNEFIIADGDNYYIDENGNTIKGGVHKVNLGSLYFMKPTTAEQ